MSPFWIVVIGVWCSAAFALTGCDTRVSHPDPAADIYLSESANAATNPPSLSVSNKVGGSITIGAGDDDKIAADVIATGVGADLERALEEADGHFVLTNTITNIGNEVQVAAPGANAKDSAQLQVRVPAGTSLSGVTIPAGDVTVHGKLGNVKAIVSGQGNINLLGPRGVIDLSTGQGSITAKLAPGDNDVTARTQGGNVDIMAASAAVTATTTNGDVRFIGSLRGVNLTHTIEINGAGNIDVALLPYQPAGSGQLDRRRTRPYQVVATTSANPIIAEYPLTVTVDNGSRVLTVCGFIHSPGPYDYHIENTPVRHFGRIEVSPVATTTFYFTGTLGADYYRFDTDRPNVLIYAPVPQSIHIYTAEQLNRFMARKDQIDRGCEGALDALATPAIVMNLKTGRGRVSIRHIFSKQD